MKLLKKLLPITTIASTALVVTPFVTSCSAGVTSFEWKPKYQKDATSIELSYSDLTKYGEISREYFEDKQSKYFIEDVYYNNMLSIKETLEQTKQKQGYSNVSVSFNVKIDGVSLTQKNLKITTPIEKEVFGYQINMKLTINQNWSYKFNETKNGETDISKVEHNFTENSTTVYDLSNYYAFLIVNNSKLKYFVTHNTNLDWSCTRELKEHITDNYINSYKDGSTEQLSSYSEYNTKETFTKKSTASPFILSGNSYYFDKCTVSIKE